VLERRGGHGRLGGVWSSDVCSSDLPRSERGTRRWRKRYDGSAYGRTSLRMRNRLVRGARPPPHRRHGAGGSLNVNRVPFRCVSRSEEHTSELQSLTHLLCRLLLVKT